MGAIIMIVYEATKELFVKDVIENNIANRIEQLYRLRVGQNVNPRRKETTKEGFKDIIKKIKFCKIQRTML